MHRNTNNSLSFVTRDSTFCARGTARQAFCIRHNLRSMSHCQKQGSNEKIRINHNLLHEALHDLELHQLIYETSWKFTSPTNAMVHILLGILVAVSVLGNEIVALSTADQGTTTWKPKISSLEERRYLRGLKHESETIGSIGFHHFEFICGDAKSMANQFSLSLGMPITCMTGQSTGNDQCVSYGLVSGDFRLLLTAPYSKQASSSGASAPGNVVYDAPDPLPQFNPAQTHEFFQRHGLAARAVGILVKDAKAAYDASVANGAKPVLDSTFVPTCHGQAKKGVSTKGCFISEVQLYPDSDVVLRFVSYLESDKAKPHFEEHMSSNVAFLPHLAPLEGKLAERKTFGIYRVDHAVGNVPNLRRAHDEIAKFTGFHEFAEFTAEDVGTVDSGLNSVVLASDTEEVLLPLNEPTNGKYVFRRGSRRFSTWGSPLNNERSRVCFALLSPQTKITDPNVS